MASNASSVYSKDITNKLLRMGLYIAGSAGFLIAGYKLGEKRGFKTDYSLGEAREDDKRSQSDEDLSKKLDKAFDEGYTKGTLWGMDKAIQYMKKAPSLGREDAWLEWTEFHDKREELKKVVAEYTAKIKAEVSGSSLVE